MFYKIPPTPGSHPRRTHNGLLRTVMKFALLLIHFRPMTLLYGAASSHPPHARQHFVINKYTALNATRHHIILNSTRKIFINASECINPELGQLGGDGSSYHRWQECMLRYRRDNKTGGPGTSSQKGRRHRSSRQHSQGQPHNSNSINNSHDAYFGVSQQASDGGYGRNTISSAITVHQSVTPSPVSTNNAPNMRLGPLNNSNPNARQPGTFHDGN